MPFLAVPATLAADQKTLRDELLIRFGRLSERACFDSEFASYIINETKTYAKDARPLCERIRQYRDPIYTDANQSVGTL